MPAAAFSMASRCGMGPVRSRATPSRPASAGQVGLQLVGMLTQVPGADDFVPEVDRPGPIADEDDQVFAELPRCSEGIAPTAGGIEEDRVGAANCLHGGEFTRITN